MKYLFIISTLAILSIVAIPSIQSILGFYPGYPSWEMAQIAVQKKNVKLCDRITALPWAIFVLGPPTAERRISCVHRYASLAKDPSACELLMPSSYGLSCVAGAKENDLCSFVNNEMWWMENGVDKKMPRSECKKESGAWSAEARACCTISKVSSIRSENDCSPLKTNIPYYDECLYRMAYKNHDPTSCENITNQNRKMACKVSATALKQDPSICTGCTPLLETLKDL